MSLKRICISSLVLAFVLVATVCAQQDKPQKKRPTLETEDIIPTTAKVEKPPVPETKPEAKPEAPKK